MKNSIFEITEKTRNRTFKATVEDVPVGDSVMRTTCTVEKTTSESGEVKTIKTRKIVEYEPGDTIPDQERAIGACFAPPAAAPAGETRPPDGRLQQVSLSADEFTHMMVEKLNGAIGASLAADPPADIVEDVQAAEEPSVVMIVDSADARMLAELEAVEPDHAQEDDGRDLRSKILAKSAYEEPAAQPVAQSVAQPVASVAVAPAAEPSRECAAAEPDDYADVSRAVDLLVLDCHYRQGLDHGEKTNSLYSAVGKFYYNKGEPKTTEEVGQIVKKLMFDRTACIQPADMHKLLDAYPEYQDKLMRGAPEHDELLKYL